MARTQKDEQPKDEFGKEVQAQFDADEAKGYFGSTPDDTPNENYTVAGVLAGKPTPETTKQ